MLRNEQKPENCWDLTRLYASDAAWEAARTALEQALPALGQWQGRLGEGPRAFADCLADINAAGEKLERLYVYANQTLHQDAGNTAAQSMADRAENLLVTYGAVTAFFVPEALSLPEETLAAYEAAPELAAYTHFMDNLRRQAAHTLSPAEEQLLAQAQELAAGPEQIFAMLNEADLDLGQMTDEAGQTVTLTKGLYTKFLESPDRRVRQEAYEKLYNAYGKQKNTLAAIYAASVKKDEFYARAKKYDSALAMALADDAIPLSVYDNLTESVREALPLLHRYAALRKQQLGLTELCPYDLYVPLCPPPAAQISYAEAKETVKKGLAPLGTAYLALLQTGFDSRWIDVYENQGKRSGAYSWGAYPGPPYVLLNHNGTTHSMFTLAHEMGHALHSYLSWANLPFHYSGHKIFVAEVASTVNEALLLAYLLEHAQTREEKLFYLNYRLEQFRGTFFRQTMFAEFERAAHDKVRQGQPLNVENLSEAYAQLNREYYGPALAVDGRIALEWARIPHFYTAYYVYQYATGYSAAVALSQRILQEGAPAVARYLDFLSKGSSEYSIDLLRGAGVDMTSPEPIRKAAALFGQTLDELEALL